MPTKAIRRKADPFVKRSTLRHLTMGETPSVRAVALQLHFGMVTAIHDGDGFIHASWREVAEWSGVSYASVKRAVARLRALGWIRELSGHRIVFDYSRSVPREMGGRAVPAAVEKAQFEPVHDKEGKTFQDGYTHPSAKVPTGVPEPSPSGGDGLSVEAERAGDSAPSAFGLAVAALVEAGADRAGAVVAVRAARKVGALELGTVRRILEAVASMPSKPFRPGGLICAAVARPELGRKIIRDAAWAASRRGKASRAVGGSAAAAESSGNCGRPCKRPDVPPVLDRLEIMRRTVRDWLGLADPEDESDRAWILRAASDRGWSRADLRAVPELRAWL